MLVKELKDRINNYNKEELTKIIVELYKRIPKRVKEDYDIDCFIKNLETNKPEKENNKVTIEELEKDIIYFLDCVNNDLYASPNKIISKNERSKWRFKVKNYYKQLNSFKPDTKEGIKATDLLKELFIILSHGSNYLLFTNWETFRAIQISQGEFLETIVKRKLSCGISKDNLKYCVDLLNVDYDPYGYYKDVFFSFRSCLKTVDLKYMIIEFLKDEANYWIEKGNALRKEKKNDFNEVTYTNYFVELITDIYFELLESDAGIKYFQKYYIERDPEIKEYILLNILENFNLYKEWIMEYESHLGKVDYRKSLKETYTKLKKAIK